MTNSERPTEAGADMQIKPEGFDPDLIERISAQTLAQKLDLDPGTFAPLLDLANQLQKQMRWKEARDLYVKLGLIDPAQIDIQIGLARCATELEEHDLAIKAAANVIRLAPEDSRGYLLSGKNCLLIGQFEEAREDLQDAVRLAGSDESLRRQALLLLSQLEMITPSVPSNSTTR